MVGFSEAVKLFFRRYVDFRGRSTRAEYWWVQLFAIGMMVLLVSLVVIVDPNALDEYSDPNLAASFVLLGFAAFLLALVIPQIALTVRRFHDVGLSGWIAGLALLVSVVPLLGLLATLGIFVVCVLPSKPAVLKWGPPRNGQVLPRATAAAFQQAPPEWRPPE